jgi:hypothetical protein
MASSGLHGFHIQDMTQDLSLNELQPPQTFKKIVRLQPLGPLVGRIMEVRSRYDQFYWYGSLNSHLNRATFQLDISDWTISRKVVGPTRRYAHARYSLLFPSPSPSQTLAHI